MCTDERMRARPERGLKLLDSRSQYIRVLVQAAKLGLHQRVDRCHAPTVLVGKDQSMIERHTAVSVIFVPPF
jgi:hypothetical protein